MPGHVGPLTFRIAPYARDALHYPTNGEPSLPHFSIHGYEFTCSHEYTSGHICTQAEAEVLQRALVRTLAKGLARVIAAGKEAKRPPAEIHAEGEAYINDHLRGFAQGFERTRAIAVEARRIAQSTIETRLYAQGKTLRDIAESEFESLVSTLSLRENILAEATRRIDDIQRIAREAHESLVAHDESGEEE